MTIKYLLDTNVVSELIKSNRNPQVMAAFQRHSDQCAVSAPTIEELTFGCARLAPGARRSELEAWLAGIVERMPVAPFDTVAALWMGRERARLTRVGMPPPRADAEIAAIAVTNGLVLVTRNGKDFAAFRELAVEDWHAAK